MKSRTASTPTAPAELHAVEVHLDRLLAEREMTLQELAGRAGVTVVNLSVLKNGRARAVRFSTLTAICRVLDCQPGDLLSVRLGD
ncbi:MAG: helix-turn-helix transcriptional regulator [Nocardioides sp.]